MEPFMETQGIVATLISLWTQFFPKTTEHERAYIVALNLNSVVCLEWHQLQQKSRTEAPGLPRWHFKSMIFFLCYCYLPKKTTLSLKHKEYIFIKWGD